MAVHFDSSDPDNLSADERVSELAAIFAAGVLRMRRGAPHPETDEAAPDLQESDATGLDQCAETRLHGQRG